MTYPTPTGHSTAPGYCWYCDCDIACPDHPDTSCGNCEYSCHCVDHDMFSGDCEDLCTERIGELAFDRGAGRIPIFDPTLMKFVIAGGSADKTAELLKGWLKGWDIANLMAPVVPW